MEKTGTLQITAWLRATLALTGCEGGEGPTQSFKPTIVPTRAFQPTNISSVRAREITGRTVRIGLEDTGVDFVVVVVVAALVQSLFMHDDIEQAERICHSNTSETS